MNASAGGGSADEGDSGSRGGYHYDDNEAVRIDTTGGIAANPDDDCGRPKNQASNSSSSSSPSRWSRRHCIVTIVAVALAFALLLVAVAVLATLYATHDKTVISAAADPAVAVVTTAVPTTSAASASTISTSAVNGSFPTAMAASTAPAINAFPMPSPSPSPTVALSASLFVEGDFCNITSRDFLNFDFVGSYAC